MNVTLPEKKGLGKKQIIIYVSIILVCIICVIIAFYVQFYARISIAEMIGIKTGEAKLGQKSEEEIETLKAEFDQIFNNSIEYENDEGKSDRADDTQELVYTKYQKKESKLNNYDLEINIPYINIDNDIIKQYNEEIENVFVKKAESILQGENQNTIYTVEYVANVQDGIVSLMIKSNLKEGTSAQRVIIRTYNYDLRNKKEISLEEVLSIEKIDKEQMQQEIINKIEIEQKKVEDLKELGYEIYNRDVSRDIYKIENTTEFYLNNNALYIIYPYGNETNTSETDLIII